MGDVLLAAAGADAGRGHHRTHGRSQNQRDDRSSYPAGGKAPGERVCGLRHAADRSSVQRLVDACSHSSVQALGLLDAALGVLFLVNALQDTRSWLAMRRAQRA